MASDLSKLLQDGLCSTLTALLSKDAQIKETTKIHEKDLLDIQTLKIDSTFEFANITSTWSFIMPAYSASYIFNAMLGDTSEPVDEIDADITDAINEFIANVSGGLSTIINGSELEDLGSVKSTTTLDGIIEKNQIEDTDNMFKILIDLDGVDITIFVTFDKVIMPFIEAISKSKKSFYPVDEIVEESHENAEEEIDNREIENLELTKGSLDNNELENIETQNQDSENKTKDKSDDSNDEEEIELSEEEKKAKKLKKFIIAISALIILTITTGIVMYFMGMFDPVPIVKEDTNTTKVIKNKDDIDIVKYPNKNSVKFSQSKINVKRLNTRLEELTKYTVLSPNEIKELEKVQQERLKNLEKEAMLLEFSKLNKEEKISPKVLKQQSSTEDKTVDNNNTKIVEKIAPIVENLKAKIVEDNKLKFILVHSLKYKLFKEMILKSDTKKARISICKDKDGRTAVYIGPFENKNSQSQMLKLIQEKQTSLKIELSNITQEEFDIRCNF